MHAIWGAHGSRLLRHLAFGLLFLGAAVFSPAQANLVVFLFLLVLAVALKSVARSMGLMAGAGDEQTARSHALREVGSSTTLVADAAVSAAAAIGLLLGAEAAFGRERLVGEALKIRDILFFGYSEYLFFFGASFLAFALLQKRRTILAAAALGTGVVWVVFHKSLTAFLGSLGVDSVSELDKVDIAEARFWLATAGEILKPAVNFKVIGFYLAAAAALLWAARSVLGLVNVARRNALRLHLVAGLMLMGGAVHLTLSETLLLFLDNSRVFLSTQRNFAGTDAIQVRSDAVDTNMVVYIGESTSVMNMGLYGYPRNTTPELAAIEKDDTGFIRFDNVLSTHTHTAWSLLEALSFGLDRRENYLPINHRRRVPIVQVLQGAGMKPVLVSNQGSTGTWNQAAPIIFGQAQRHFSTNSQLLGNSDYKVARPWDHVLFEEQVVKLLRTPDGGKNVVFFHSYAGHGDYLDNIPEEFRRPVDDFISSHPEDMLTGKLLGQAQNIEAYDSAIRYVDHAVARAVEAVKAAEAPTILVYFSDHGDAVYAGRGHDSARFSHEMVRVPFFVYFNEAARKSRAELFARYRKLAASREVATLAQLPATILDLTGVKLESLDRQRYDDGPVVGEKAERLPIVLREKDEGFSYVNFDLAEVKPPEGLAKSFIDNTDYATRYFSAVTWDLEEDFMVCYHAANTFGKTLRGALVASCLEADFVVEPDGIHVYHPPLKNTGYRAEDFLRAARGKSLWVDAKNLLSHENCTAMADFLGAHRTSLSAVLVEFPSGSHAQADQLKSCTRSMKRHKVRTSYYVPTDVAVACSRAISTEHAFEATPACRTLEADLRQAHDSGLYSDISFDYLGAAAVQRLPFLTGYTRNTWNVMPQNLKSVSPRDFGMIILNNDDPNSPVTP